MQIEQWSGNVFDATLAYINNGSLDILRSVCVFMYSCRLHVDDRARVNVPVADFFLKAGSEAVSDEQTVERIRLYRQTFSQDV